MNCQKLQEQFDDRLDGRFDDARAREFDAHVAGCLPCRQQWHAYQALWNAVGRPDAVEPSFGFAQRTLRRLHEEPSLERVRFWQWPVFRWATAGGLAVLLAAGSLIAYYNYQARRNVEAYAAVHQDRLEDLDVIAALDKLQGDSKL